jgi:hypothetical protein
MQLEWTADKNRRKNFRWKSAMPGTRLPLSRGLVLALTMSALIAAADDPPRDDSTRHAAQLVERLGDEAFNIREDAAAELRALGLAAKPALAEGLKSADPEVRWRCRRIMAQVLELDYQQRIEAFAADKLGTGDHDLPGWERFQATVGNDLPSRVLFLEILQAEPGLLTAIDRGPPVTGNLFALRVQQIQQMLYGPDQALRQQVQLGNLAAMFFVGTMPQIQITEQTGAYLYNFVHQPAFQQRLRPEPEGEPLRQLLGVWIRERTGALTAYQNLMLALRFELKAGLEPAIAILQDPAAKPHTRQYAILVVAKFGSKRHLPLLEPLLADDSPLAVRQVNGRQVTTQLRDVALAGLVHLSGRKLNDFGFNRAQINPPFLYSISTLGFEEPQSREAALRKWRSGGP